MNVRAHSQWHFFRNSFGNGRATLMAAGAVALALQSLGLVPAWADETCGSPYMAKLTGHEDYVYVWTLGMDGVGDESDKLVTIDAREGSATFGQVIDVDSVGAQTEAHYGGFTDDRRHFWAAGLANSEIFVFDVASDPANPQLVKTIDDFEEASGGAAGPHGAYALPGRMLILALSNQDGTGQTALVEYSNEGEFIATHWLPTAKDAVDLPGAEFADGYGYDARVLPRRNVMLSSSFTGRDNYMRPLGELVGDAEAMTRFGNSMVLWDFHARTPMKVFHVPGAPLEIRWALGEDHDYAFTAAALTSKLWLIYLDDEGEWQAKEVADIGDPAALPLPVDISISSDDRRLFVNTFGDGMTRVFDISDPHAPHQVYEKHIGA
jgi:methanethiol oxidase